MVRESKTPAYSFSEVDEIVVFVAENAQTGDHIVVMSNGGFGGIHEKLLKALGARFGETL